MAPLDGDIDALKAQLRDRDATIAKQAAEIETLESRLHEKETELKRCEATLQRIKLNVQQLDAKAKRSADNELAALLKVSQMEQALAQRSSHGGATTGNMQRSESAAIPPMANEPHSPRAVAHSHGAGGLAIDASATANTRKRLTAFYEHYAPKKLVDVDKVLYSF